MSENTWNDDERWTPSQWKKWIEEQEEFDRKLEQEENEKWMRCVEFYLPVLRVGAARLVSKGGSPDIVIVDLDRYLKIRTGASGYYAR